MRVTNQTTKDVSVHDELGELVDQYQPGIKSVTVPASGTADIPDVLAANSKDLQTLLTSGKLKITGKQEPTGIVGLAGGNIVYSARVPLAAGVNFQIAFGTDGGANIDEVAPDQVFASADDYIVIVVLESALATDVISITKAVGDFTIYSGNASDAAVLVLRVV